MGLKQITITGDLCSFKTTVSKILCDKLSMSYFSIGELFRKEAEDREISLVKLHKSYEGTLNDLDLDKKVFDKRSEDNLIVDSRLGWFFLPESFKVLLTVSEDEMLKRAKAGKRKEIKNLSDEEALLEMRARRELEINRYKTIYSVDIQSKKNYDLIIDTSYSTSEQIVEIIWVGFLEHMSKSVKYFNFKNLIPSKEQISPHTFENIYLYPVPNLPIEVIKRDNFYYIDGHNLRAIRYYIEGVKIPCRIVQKDSELSITNKTIKNWEDMFGFKFNFYPIALKTG